ncbi:thioredoxin family protein [Flavisericum labens]|uniref:thioredoxin family protein n=1 Tax=Flavisericum labens TaxID=3377112 RepID=UPI00387B18A4
MNALILSSLERGLSYTSYRDLMKRLVSENSTTGLEKTKTLVNYTKLNDRRMKRLDKTIKVSEDQQKKIAEFNHPTTWLVISESWCGDAAQVLPAINKIAELNDNIDLKIVMRDENPELMDKFLTNGARSVPKIIMVDNDTGDVINTYGPRPSEATLYVKRFKAKYGKLTPEFKEDLQHWYNKDKGQNILQDVTEMLCKLEPSVCQ